MYFYHSSPDPITVIGNSGRFGSFLFFSSHIYVTDVSGAGFVYRIEIDEDEIIRAESLLYHENAEILQPITQQIMDMLGCDEDSADDLLSQKDDCGDAEKSWDIQLLTAKAARMLGFRGVSMSDEQGRAYMIDMLGREHELEEIKA
jgi:hypothetical protein